VNERIKELAVQAGNYAYNMNPEQDSYGRAANPRKFQQDRDTKFAELIVRECARVAKLTEADDGDDYKSGRQWAGIDLLKHFGVDE